MLDWLKGILGDKYSDEIDTKVSAEIGKNFVSKSDFNQVNEAKKKAESDLKERDAQIESLKSAGGDADALKKQIEDLQKQNAAAKTEYEKQLTQMQLENAVDKALTSAGAKNIKAVRALLDPSGLKLGEDGKLDGLTAQLEALKKSDGYLFKENEAPSFKGFQPGASGDGVPKGVDLSKMTYSEMTAYMASNGDAKIF